MKPAQIAQINIKRLTLVLLLAFGAAALLGAVCSPKDAEKPVSAPEGAAVCGEPVKFLADCERARLLSAQSGKPLLLFFTEPGSPFSLRVKQEIFADREVSQLSREFVCASVDTGNAAAIPLIRKYAVTAAPTVLLISPRGETSVSITQFRSPAEFKAQMKAALSPVAWQQASLYLRCARRGNQA